MRIHNFIETQYSKGNDDVTVKHASDDGVFKVVEWKRDLSVPYYAATSAYFASEMNVRRRQLIIELDSRTIPQGIALQAGAMQWMVGQISASTGVKSAGDFLSKVARGSVTGEQAIKPEYKGDGVIVCEPTYRHIFITDPSFVGGAMTINDGMFIAADANLRHKAAMVNSPSAALGGKEGLFNLSLSGQGALALESPVPSEELITVDIYEGEELKVDGNFAIAWSTNLRFTVERVTKTLIGSAASGEGLVNVYRGEGRVLLAPMSGVPTGIDEGAM